MASRTTMADPVQLSEPEFPAPEPVRGCDVCGALFGQWKQATEKGSPAYDPSHATDLAVEIGRHPHAWQKGNR
ncbi:hypothetical protein [Streptomyces prunicolor]|uniref:hypothetical protein n=1 Tax=Streptomyces prunicolor TaxID=67348 RepID=UPI001FDF258F|nr:hypothetical protein [Streptomyces prunicolor]MCX5234825.1 hypothetical protein [Streptomyces prunicolor]